MEETRGVGPQIPGEGVAGRGVGPVLELGEAQRADGLVVFPLVTREEAELPYLLLADALEAGTLEITEVGSGMVPSLRAMNMGDRDVLVLDGEQLVGAKQNRMTSRTLILPAKSETEIPVSCMERGRWHSVGRTFRSAPQHSPAKVRKKARKLEALRAAQGIGPSPDALAATQHEVWSEIRARSDELGVRSDTEALDELYAAKLRDLGEWAGSFPPVDGQVGLLAFLDGEPLGLDGVGGRSHWARLHDRILQGYLLDALGGRRGRRAAAGGPATEARGPCDPSRGTDVPGAIGQAEPDEADALRFLGAARSARRSEAPTVGKGSYRVLSGSVVGGELVDSPVLAHRCAFSADEEDGGRGVEGRRGTIAGPRMRGRRFG